MKLIPFHLAYKSLQVITVGIMLYHLLIITGLIPYTAVWGGRLNSSTRMIQFESVSLMVNGIFLLTIFLKSKRQQTGQSSTIANLTLWSFVLLYILNTLGNLVSISSLEAIIFTPFTLILAILTARVALE